jgi:hypothetical protein
MVVLAENDYLIEICNLFREAIIKCKAKLGIPFNQFPIGCCGDTSILLGTFLSNIGYGVFYYYSGEKSDNQNSNQLKSHAWIQNEEGLIIDIAADQFPEISDTIIVTINSKWHSEWNGKKENLADYKIYDERTREIFKRKYECIMTEMKMIL